MSQAEIAWAAGLFEGEGSINFNGTTPIIKLAMCDEPVVRRFAEVIGSGAVYKPKRVRTWNQVWWWQKGGADVEQIVGLLWPWLGDRRRAQCLQALAGYDSYLAARRERRTRTCVKCGSVFLSGYNKPNAKKCRPCWGMT